MMMVERTQNKTNFKSILAATSEVVFLAIEENKTKETNMY